MTQPSTFPLVMTSTLPNSGIQQMPSDNVKQICPSCATKASRLKLKQRVGFVLLALGAALIGGCGFAYLIAESKDGGPARQAQVGKTASSVPNTGVEFKPADGNTVVSLARRNSVIGMGVGAVCLFTASVLIFRGRKLPSCNHLVKPAIP